MVSGFEGALPSQWGLELDLRAVRGLQEGQIKWELKARLTCKPEKVRAWRGVRPALALDLQPEAQQWKQPAPARAEAGQLWVPWRVHSSPQVAPLLGHCHSPWDKLKSTRLQRSRGQTKPPAIPPALYANVL